MMIIFLTGLMWLLVGFAYFFADLVTFKVLLAVVCFVTPMVIFIFVSDYRYQKKSDQNVEPLAEAFNCPHCNKKEEIFRK